MPRGDLVQTLAVLVQTVVMRGPKLAVLGPTLAVRGPTWVVRDKTVVQGQIAEEQEPIVAVLAAEAEVHAEELVDHEGRP